MKILLLSCMLFLTGCGANSIVDKMMARADDMCISVGNGTAVAMDFTVTKYSKYQELQLKRVECGNSKEIFPYRTRDWVR